MRILPERPLNRALLARHSCCWIASSNPCRGPWSASAAFRPTYAPDGKVAGTWRYDGGRVVVTPFEPLPADDMKAGANRGRALEAFLG